MSEATASPLLHRAVVQAFGDDMEGRLRAALVEYVAHAGHRTLEQCLRLPRSPAKRRALVRDAWLRVALHELRLMDGDATPATLHDALTRFHTRSNLWRNWLEAGGPPVGAASVHVALFRAIEAADNRVLCRRHVAAILEKKNSGFFQPPLLQSVHLMQRG